MDYRLIALDLDHTLLNDDFKISARNLEALQKAASNGIKVTIATGRMFRSALPYARQLGVKLPLITYHGALIKEVAGEQRILRKWCIPKDLALEIIGLGEAEGFHINLYINDTLYVKEENENTKFYKGIAAIPLEIVGDLADYLEQAQDEPIKLSIINREGRLQNLQIKLKEKYGTELSILISRPDFLEITYKEATKGKALQYLAERENILASQTIAIGDNYNDVDMLQYAGIGVAVSNAPPDVQKEANFVTGTNTEDGVALFLERYIL